MTDLRAVRVVVADDHPIWRSGLRADLGANFHVVGEAGDADEAIEVIRSLKPDLVVCDLHMPGGGGLKVARACGEDTHIVMLTVVEAERDLLDAVAAGAVGYLVKSTPTDELRRELWRAAKGEPVFSPALASLVLGEFRRMAKASGPIQPLSEREREVLQYVARGHIVPGDRRAAVHRREDGREPRAQHPGQAPPQPAPGAGPLRPRARHRVMAGGWRSALGEARVLVSGFGKWGGGVYDLTDGVPDALDDVPTSGLALGGGRLWRVLRAPGEQTSTGELLSYDARGVRSYQRLDAVRDPHDVIWFDGAPHVSSSWDNAVWRIGPGGDPALMWQGSAVSDGWHVNSLVAVGGALHVCAFGRFERTKGWKSDGEDGAGFVRDLRAGRDVLRGLAHPHTPRRRGDRWYVCESTRGTLTELDADGTVVRRTAVRRFTRGLALTGRYALVGGNAHRDRDDDRGEVVVVDVTRAAVVDRIPMPCLEVYDILLVPPPVIRGVGAGFGANASRAVEQHRTADRPPERRPTPDDAAVRLVTPRAAAELAAAGRRLDPEVARRSGVRGTLPGTVVAGSVTALTVQVVNQTGGPLATVPPRPIKVGARWRRLDPGDGDAPDDPGTTNPLVPLPRVLPTGTRTAVDVPLEAPGEPGGYEVRIALRQPGLGWFGVRVQGRVEVISASASASGSPPASVGLGTQGREQDDVADGVGVGEEHDEAVHADAQPAGRGHAVLEGP